MKIPSKILKNMLLSVLIQVCFYFHDVDIISLAFALSKSNRRSHWKCSIKKISSKFHNIYRKTPALESLFKKVAGLRLTTLLKKDSNTGAFLWILQNL